MVAYGHGVSAGAGDSGAGTVYYDYARVCQQIAAYTGDTATWVPREVAALETYINEMFDGPGATYAYRMNSGPRNFPHGMYYHWLAGGSRAALALEYLQGYTSQSSSSFNYPFPAADAGEAPTWPNREYWAGQAYSREVAYWIQAHIYAERTGQARKTLNGVPYLQRYIEFAANHLRQWRQSDWTTPGDGTGWMQSFMLFITLYALTEFVDYMREQGEDENQWWPASGWQTHVFDWPLPPWATISEAICDMTRWIFDEAIVQDAGNPDNGQRVWVADMGSGYGAFRYSDRNYSNGGTDPKPDLNQLCTPVFGWVGTELGDETFFTQRGDLVFEGGVRGAYLTSNKVFNQNYLKSFDYVTARAAFGT